MTENSRLEILLRHEQWIVYAGLLAITGLSWTYLLSGAGVSMNAPEMNMLDHAWSLYQWIIIFMMWWIMMIAMMLPGAAPTILLYARVTRHTQKNIQATHTTIPVIAFVSGYLFSWLLFSIIATILHWLLSQNNWLSLNMFTINNWLSGGLLIAAGFYQLTPLKAACLKHCQSPAEFITGHMKGGHLGAFQMGIEHGFFCVGCCWSLMLLLFVGGVMNLLWIAILTLFVLSEKILTHGRQLSGFTGYILIFWGSVIFTTSL